MKRYVTDTHSILWYLATDRRLPRQVRRIFGSAEEGRVQILVPSIVLVEAIFLMQRERIPQSLVVKLLALPEDPKAGICVVPLNVAVAQAVGDFGLAAVPDLTVSSRPQREPWVYR